MDDREAFFAYVEAYARTLGWTVQCIRQSNFRDLLECWRKLFQWAGVDTGLPWERHLQLDDWYMFLNIRVTKIFSRGSYLKCDGYSGLLKLRIPRHRGISQWIKREDLKISGYMVVYMFLVADHCFRLALTKSDGVDLFQQLWGSWCIQPDDDILIGGFADQTAPTPQRLAELDVKVLKDLDGDLEAFYLIRDQSPVQPFPSITARDSSQ